MMSVSVPRRPSIKPLIPRAIGFSFGDDEPEAQESSSQARPGSAKMSSLGTLHGSLLVFSSVLKGAVGEAFLAALAITTKYQATNKDVLAAFGKFYSLLLQAGYGDFETYLLDQLLLGRENPFARACAEGKVQKGAPILRAVEYDLDILQQLAVPISRLAGFVSDAAPLSGPYWREAASSAALKSDLKRLNPSGGGIQKEKNALPLDSTERFILAPPTSEQLEAWIAAISSKDEWSQAAGIVVQYFNLYGFGVTSRNTTLRWSKGSFEGLSDVTETPPPKPSSLNRCLSCLQPQLESITENTLRFMEGLPASHVLIGGPCGSGKSWLLWEGTLLAGSEKGLRLVEVPPSEANNVLEIARACARYPRIRFILVLDHLELPVRGALAADLMNGLASGGSSQWPENCLLYVGASSSSAISFSDPIVSRFGIVETTAMLTEAQFLETVKELAGKEVSQPEDLLKLARTRGGLTVRTANMLV
jgi:predicted AAA+ superfamily ATPase